MMVAGALFFVAVALDQVTKVWIRATFQLGESRHVIGPVNLTYVENTGAVFGLGQGYVLIPTIATIAILVLMPLAIRYLRIHYGHSLDGIEAACVGLIAGGAIGNLIDRIMRSAVTDFVDVEILPGIRWPAFNVADACVVVGTILLFVVFYRHDTHQTRHHANP
jgi:signal peptidase II